MEEGDLPLLLRVGKFLPEPVGLEGDFPGAVQAEEGDRSMDGFEPGVAAGRRDYLVIAVAVLVVVTLDSEEDGILQQWFGRLPELKIPLLRLQSILDIISHVENYLGSRENYILDDPSVNRDSPLIISVNREAEEEIGIVREFKSFGFNGIKRQFPYFLFLPFFRDLILCGSLHKNNFLKL